MPAGKRAESNATLYALITFVGLFIVAAVVGIIFYVKFEEQIKIADKAQNDLKEVASRREVQRIGSIVGTKTSRETYLGKMVGYLDETVTLILGGLPEDTSAQVKAQSAEQEFRGVLELTAEHIDTDTSDPNTIGLIQVVEKLKNALDNTIILQSATRKRLEDLHKEFDTAQTASRQKELELLAEKDQYYRQVQDIKSKYNELETLLRQTTDQRVQTLRELLEEERANSKELKDDLLLTQAKLRQAEDRMELALQELRSIKPGPSIDVAAFKPDGKIMSVDDATDTVYLNIGSEDRVYVGLTFSVYDKSVPIPKDGKGKAEVEVFNVEKNISAARIIHSKIKNPVMEDDIIANLIFDSEKANVFVVAGEFDLNNDGKVDYGGADKVKTLIGKSGGKVVETVSVNTDFLALGKAPTVLRKPTLEELEVYPMAMERYTASLKKHAHYQDILEQAQALSIPVFNYERFLYFIGYKTLSGRAGAF